MHLTNLQLLRTVKKYMATLDSQISNSVSTYSFFFLIFPHPFSPYVQICQLLNMYSYVRSHVLTGKSLSEALLFSEHGENTLCTKIVLNVRNKFCTQHVLPRFELGIFMYWTCNSMNNLSSYFGLVDAKIRASDKDLPVKGLL